MKFVKLHSERRKCTAWVVLDQIFAVVAARNSSADGSCCDTSVVHLSDKSLVYDDRTPEALVAAIEEATK